tara:strand:+ start:2678 stop:3433 length:756 start_codon:yes stop_codon:yes gene_type:complete
MKISISNLTILLLSFIAITACDLKSYNIDKKELSEVEKKLVGILPDSIKLISIKETDIDGYYEVNFEGVEPLFVSSDGKYLISGDIYLISKDGLVNKSESRRDFQRKTEIDSLDKKNFITFKPVETKYPIYVFTDVDCGYCRRMHSKIDEYLLLGIEVNYLAYPRSGLNTDSYNKIVSAWCSNEPNKSLTELKKGETVEENLCLENPVEIHFNLGRRLGVQGTPSIITEEGKMIPGYLPPRELLNLLETNS